MEIFVYRKDAERVEEGFSAKELPLLLAENENVVWVDFLGESEEQNAEAKRIMLDIFHFHPLTVEDCFEPATSQRSKAFLTMFI